MKTNVMTIEDEPSIIGASKIVIIPGLRPRRIVLREVTDKFIVHTEYLDVSIRAVEASGERPRCEAVFTHADFDNGNYFDFNAANGGLREVAFENATSCFNERSGKI